MKVCTICKKEKQKSEYNKHSKRPDGLQPACKECSRARSRKYYSENKTKHLAVVKEKQKRVRLRQQKLIKEYKESKPCMDCGKKYPSYVMDLDHKRDKKVIVSSMPGNFSDEKIWEEIAKCDLVCANCHRERTHNKGL